MPTGVLLCGLLVVIIVLIVVAANQVMRRERAVRVRLDTIRAAEQPLLVLDSWNCRLRITPVTGKPERWWRGIVALTERELILFDRTVQVNQRLRCTWDDLRWFGRPHKYTSGDNDIWLHIEAADGWRIIQIRLYQTAMRDLVRTLKTLVAPELVTAYRRRRPYIHLGPVEAHPATQDIHGAWSVDSAVDLYLMPRFLVMLDRDRVLRKIPLEAVQRIGAESAARPTGRRWTASLPGRGGVLCLLTGRLPILRRAACRSRQTHTGSAA